MILVRFAIVYDFSSEIGIEIKILHTNRHILKLKTNIL